jgi:hypothetical protein
MYGANQLSFSELGKPRHLQVTKWKSGLRVQTSRCSSNIWLSWVCASLWWIPFYEAVQCDHISFGHSKWHCVCFVPSDSFFRPSSIYYSESNIFYFVPPHPPTLFPRISCTASRTLATATLNPLSSIFVRLRTQFDISRPPRRLNTQYVTAQINDSTVTNLLRDKKHIIF